MKVFNAEHPAALTKDQIRANIDAREAAELLIHDAGEQPPRFWEILLAKAKEKLAIAEDRRDTAMDEKEAISFEKQEMKYGKFSGYEVGEVDPEYLVWLAEGDSFIRSLRRYIKSKTFAER